MATARQAAPTGASQTIDIGALIDEQKIGPFHIQLLVWSFLIMVLDGYDLLVAALSGRALMSEFGLAPTELGPILSASLFGFFFGALIFGWIGDQFGRRVAIIAACVEFGIFTLAATQAGSGVQLFWLRALAGIGIGGVIPNTIALNAEYAPKRIRATLVILMFTGNTFGGGLLGQLAPWLIPTYGWRSLFLIGGIIPIALAVVLYFVLPESLKFLSLDESRRAEVASYARKLRSDLAIGPNDRFILPQSGTKQPFPVMQLFRGRLAVATPLLWLLFAINLMTFYFINNWMPILITSSGAPELGATATALFQYGGTAAGVIISFFVNRWGLKPVAFLFVVAIPVVASLGYLATSDTSLLIAAALAGFCLLGIQFGLNAGSGMIYPTAFRANGVGWAFGIGRIGAIAGPYIGGFLAGMPLQRLYLLASLPLIVAAVACFVLVRNYDTTQSE
jgi:AAHS family 4-hydroxybenzoate transporter-like MFS transporter